MTLEKIVEEYNKLSFEARDLENKEKRLKELETSFKEIIIKAKKTEEELIEVKKNIIQFQKIVDKIEPEISELDVVNSRLDELKNRETKITNNKLKLQDIEKKISELSIKVENIDIGNLKKTYKKTITRKSELKTKIDSIDEILDEKRKRQQELESKQKQIMEQIKEIKNLESLYRDLSIFELALSKTQIQLRQEFIDTVNYTMNDIWPDIYPYTDFSGIRLSVEEGDYILQLQDRTGRWVDVEGIASGGERTIAALVLRIAFSLVLAPQLKWLILDEPTHNLDSRAIEDLGEILKNKVGEFVSQIFLITHTKALENAATGELYRLKRDKAVDGVTILERATGI
jgi:DNA repair exonuclease SbcCD ATPase subunit